MKKLPVIAMMLLFAGPVHDAARAGGLDTLAPTIPPTRPLRDLEPRTPIHGPGPVTISAPGSYVLTSNFNAGGLTAVIVTASNVTLDLNGFTIAGNANNFGVVLGNNTLNVVVRNGIIRNFAGGVLNAGVTSVRLS